LAGALAFGAPVLANVNPWALALSLAVAVAIFRFKVGMILAISTRRDAVQPALQLARH